MCIALLESAMPQELGFAITTDKAYRKDAYRFGESQSRIVVSVSPANQAAFEATLGQARQPYTLPGTVTDGAGVIDGEDVPGIWEMKELYGTGLNKSWNNNKKISRRSFENKKVDVYLCSQTIKEREIVRWCNWQHV